jgi:hypothetical protein
VPHRTDLGAPHSRLAQSGVFATSICFDFITRSITTSVMKICWCLYFFILTFHETTRRLCAAHVVSRRLSRSLWKRRALPEAVRLLCSKGDHGIPSGNNPRSILVIDWDGCLVDTREWRCTCALEVAQVVWPSLKEKVAIYNKSTASLTWLKNKLFALTHVFYSEGEASLTCEYALAVRLLIEEQALDGGRSNDQQGKYARKFHPQREHRAPQSSRSQRLTEDRPTKLKPSGGSRPLTVGEIASNWSQGGMIRDALLTRYHCNHKHPIPFLQKAVDRHLCSSNLLLADLAQKPQISQRIQNALRSTANHLIVTVRHASDLSMAVETLASAGFPCRIVPSLFDVTPDGVSVLVQGKGTISDVVEAAPSSTNVYVLSSCWNSLAKESRCFGDDAPIRQRNQPKSLVAPTRYGNNLCLGYAEWAPNTHPTLHSSATMYPWTELVSLRQLEDILCFRVE